jgi:hypothetical protein
MAKQPDDDQSVGKPSATEVHPHRFSDRQACAGPAAMGEPHERGAAALHFRSLQQYDPGMTTCFCDCGEEIARMQRDRRRANEFGAGKRAS